MIATNSRSRNVVRASTVYAPPKAVAAVVPVTSVAAPTIERPTSATARMALRLPGRAISTARTATASSTDSPNGAIVVRSAQVTVGSRSRGGSRGGLGHGRRGGCRRSQAHESDDHDCRKEPEPEGDPEWVDRDRAAVARVDERPRGRRRDEVEQDPREEAEDDDERGQRREGQDLGRGDVGDVVTEPLQELGWLAEHDPLEHPEQVRRREDHDERRDPGDPRIR